MVFKEGKFIILENRRELGGSTRLFKTIKDYQCSLDEFDSIESMVEYLKATGGLQEIDHETLLQT